MKTPLVILVILLFACKSKHKEQAVVSDIVTTPKVVEVTKISNVEDVLIEARKLLQVPNLFRLKEAKKWNDGAGENWLLLSETGVYGNKKTETSSAKLSAVLYIKTDTGFIQQWKLNDFIKECPVDVVCEFYKNCITITDLNKNGIAEIIVVYALSCKGDVSPNEKKLILFEGKTKYALRGEELLILKKDTIGGFKKEDEQFLKLSPEIKNFAEQHWKKFGVQQYK